MPSKKRLPSCDALRWPRVTVITPSYNQGRFIRATIESVLSQDYPDIEYVVMDGGSSDDTVSILRSYAHRVRWVSEPDQGQTHAINKGLRMATGDIVAYLNSDDIYLPGAIRAVVEAFSARPEVDFVYGDSHAIDAGGNLISRVKAIPFDPDILLYDANFICQPSSFYRRRLIDDIGPFDENMHFLMDYEFFLRAAKRKARFHLVRRYLSAIRFHGQCKSLSDGVYPWHQERRRVRVRYARAKLRDHPTALALVGLIYRLKRYALLLGRGQIDFMNLGLALKLRRMAWRNPAP